MLNFGGLRPKYPTKSLQLTLKQHNNNNHRFTAIVQVNLRQLAPPVKNWRILLMQSFTARMPLQTWLQAR